MDYQKSAEEWLFSVFLIFSTLIMIAFIIGLPVFLWSVIMGYENAIRSF